MNPNNPTRFDSVLSRLEARNAAMPNGADAGNPCLPTMPQDPPPPPVPYDPIGLAAWAASNGMDQDTALALAASLLTGLAGPLSVFDPVNECETAPGLNLITTDGDGLLEGCLARLVAPLLPVQEGLLAKSSEFRLEEFEKAFFDRGYADRNTKYLARLSSPTAVDMSVLDACPEASMNRDAMTSDQWVLYENLRRPRFMLTGMLPANLTSAIAGCHSGVALAVGCLEILPAEAAKRNHRITEIIRHFEGVTADQQSTQNRSSLPGTSLVLSGILRLSPADRAWLVSNRRDIQSKALPIVTIHTPDPDQEADEVSAAEFQRLFGSVAHPALARRRARIPVSAMFHTTETIGEFLRQQRRYKLEIQAVAEPLRVPHAAGLPAAMAWTLLMLTAHRSDLDHYIIETVFTAARNLHARAVSQLREQDQHALSQQRMRIARKLVKRLHKLGPCKRRELVRGLDKQSLQFNEPVISALLETGVFTENADRVLDIGLTQLNCLEARHLSSMGLESPFHKPSQPPRTGSGHLHERGNHQQPGRQPADDAAELHGPLLGGQSEITANSTDSTDSPS